MNFSEKTVEALFEYGKNILGCAIVIVVGVILTKIMLKFARRLLVKSSLDESVYKFILKTLKYAAYTVIFVVSLTCLNIPTAPLVTVLGACGAAIALALKDSLGNVAGGLIILVSKPFVRGDYIETAGTQGKVQSIDLMVTTLKSYDNKVIAVPNGAITSSMLVNQTKEPIRRVDLKLTVAYDTDLNKVWSTLLAVAESCEDALLDPPPLIGVAAHGESAIEIDYKVWCDTPNYWDVMYYLQEQVKVAFDEADIKIPYPQMDVHVVK